MTGIAIANGIAAASPNLAFANMILPLYVVTALYFGGFLIIYDQIPKGWQWYSHSVFLRYAWTALMVNQFDTHVYTKTSSGDVLFNSTSTGSSSLTDNDFNANGGILKFYNLNHQDKWGNFAYLNIICFVVGLLGYFAVKYIDYSKR